jgi:hypothetical protein
MCTLERVSRAGEKWRLMAFVSFVGLALGAGCGGAQGSGDSGQEVDGQDGEAGDDGGPTGDDGETTGDDGETTGDDGETTGDDGGVVSDDGPGPVEVRGVARRTCQLGAGQDGIGTLCVSVVDGCPSMTHQQPQGFAFVQILSADLSAAGAEVPFSIDLSALAPGRYELSGYLQEAGGECSGAPAKDDPVTFKLAGASPCPAFDFQGQSLDGLVLELNFLMPF